MFRKTTMKERIAKTIGWFYFPFIRKWIPRQTFYYAACGGGNLLLDLTLYAVLYNFVLDKQNLDLGFVVISPYIAAFLISFPITFYTGFWLMKNIAFVDSPLRNRTQLFRYLTVVIGTILINYFGLKLLVGVFGFYPTPSKLVVTVAAVLVSYFSQKHFTFRGCADIEEERLSR